MKDQRFNIIFECYLRVLHHLDDLDTYQNILNGVAILDRTFLDMELLKPIFCATALIGIHITSPFLSFILDTRTTYETLITTFPVIYENLSNVDIEQMLKTEQRVVNLSMMKSLRKHYVTADFANDEKFEKTLRNSSL